MTLCTVILSISLGRAKRFDIYAKLKQMFSQNQPFLLGLFL